MLKRSQLAGSFHSLINKTLGGQYEKSVRLGLAFLLFLFLFNLSVFAKSSINNKADYQLNFKSNVLRIGESFNLKVVAKNQNVNSLKLVFSSSNNRVASVDKNGRVKAIGAGYADINVTIKEKNIKLICKVQVKPVEVKAIDLNSDNVTLKVGETFDLGAQVYPYNATNKDLIWTNSNPEIVEVDNGKLLAKKTGHAVVTVYSYNKKVYNKCLISVIDEEIENLLKMPLEKQAEHIIKNYSRDGYYILESVANKKNEDILNFIKNWNAGELFNTIGVTVHEECHEYQHIMNKNEILLKRQTHIIERNPFVVTYHPAFLFYSQKALNDIPDNLKTYRWKTYVADGSNCSSNVYGAYGLLLEYEAYYYGDKAVYDTYEFFKKIPFKEENFSNYYIKIDGTAFYEFTYYILSYLKYAKENEPQSYETILNDENFKHVFRYIYTNYKSLVEDLKLKRAQEIKNYLMRMGYKVDYGMFNITITYDGISTSKSAVNNNILNLKNELEREEYKKILNEILK